MFIRQKKNKSGSTSVQLISKHRGKYRVEKTIGSSSSADGYTVNPQDAIFTGIGAIDGTGNDKLKPLYNGNIAAMAVNINVPGLTGNNVNTPMVYHYSYDQLNRLVAMDAFSSSNTFASLTKLQDYHEAVTYDPNGNIITYLRNSNNNSGSYAMDDLTYHYAAGTNHLLDIADADGLTHGTIGDIGTQSTNNYTYDEIGNLVRNNTENIGNTADGTTAGDGITWTVYGKIATITKRDPVTHAVTTTINYTYDVAGNRISKTVTQSDVTTTTWYVRDASGNVMSIYTAGNTNINSGRLSLAEIPEYGSSRLGEIKFGNTDEPDVQTALLPAAAGTLADGSSYYLTTFTRGEKIFELSNHLGNVLVTISDKRLPVDANNDGTVDSYTADVITANDYYPFGMVQPGRQYTNPGSTAYRFGFNGQEQSDEIAPNTMTAEYWEYDSRIGRRWNVDPKPRIDLSEYSVFSNNPVLFSDPYGDTLTSDQFVDALRIANNVLRQKVIHGEPFKVGEDASIEQLNAGFADYISTHSVMSSGDYADFQTAIKQYYNGLATIAFVSQAGYETFCTYVLNGKINNIPLSSHFKIQAANLIMQKYAVELVL